MYFAKYGTGERVFVGLHGWSGNHQTFSPLVPYIPEDVTFYSADLPGNGRSPAPNAWTIKNLAREIAESIAAISTSQVTILGSCSGGLIGLFIVKYLLETRQRSVLARLILIDPFAYFPWYFKVFIAPQLGRVGWYAYSTTFANPVGRVITNLSLRCHRTSHSNLTESFAKTEHRVTYRYLQLLAASGVADQFRAITIPVTIIYGENTFRAVRKSVSMWQQILPEVTCYELKGTGHLPLEESPAEVAKILFH
ncbi:MAG TPA: alpha/beta hydrolase [Blastocatellia bacterium]|nr:alpha/beta hydrolase [Blastocatellia bacterium]